MGQDLRVAGWLRFGNQAQLAKGLRAFAGDAAPGYYDENSWDISGLDAQIRLEVELPGDFTRVEVPFMAMVKAAVAGYVDYFEDGKKEFYGGGTGPVARWVVHQIDKRHKFMFASGTTSHAFPGAREKSVVNLTGKLTFESSKAVEQTLGEAKLFRLPFLTSKGIDELRLGADAFTVSGKSLTAALAIHGNARVLEAPVRELARALSLKAKTGALDVTGGDTMERTITPKGKIAMRTNTKKLPELTKVAPVAARSALPAGAAAPVEKQAENVTLLKPAAATKNAMLLSSGRLVTWSDGSISFWDLPSLAPAWSVKLGTKHDPDFAWPITGVTELEQSRVVVYHEMNGDLDLVDPARKERNRLELHGHSVYGVQKLADRCLSWSLDGTAQTFTASGEPLTKFETKVDGRVDAVHAMADGTVYVRADDKLVSYNLESGERIAEHGKCELLSSLPGGRVLIGLETHHELRDATGTLATFDFAPEYGTTVVVGGEDRYFLHAYHARIVHELRKTSRGWTSRAIITQHTKNVGGVVPLGDGLIVTHARTMPGLDEQFGFDGTVRFWDDAFEPIGSIDMRAPIERIIALPGGRGAVVMRDALRGKEVAIVDARKAKIATTLKGPKKPVGGALWIPDRGLLVWSADKTTRIYGHV